jgi:hypothetical protein
MQGISRGGPEISKEELFRQAQVPELLRYEEDPISAPTRKPMLIRSRLHVLLLRLSAPVSCTDTEINFDLRQDARPPPTRPPASPVPFVLGRELPSAPHVEPGAGVSGSSALTASMGGLPMEQAELPGSTVARSSGLSMEQSSSSSLTPAHPSTKAPKDLAALGPLLRQRRPRRRAARGRGTAR